MAILTRRRWTNWAGNQVAAPVAMARPETEPELVATLRSAAAKGLRAKAAGAGHSFNSIATTDGILLVLDRYARVLTADCSSGLVTVQSGMTLHALNHHLVALGLALPNLGDIDAQTVAGAISTGTHGTGRHHGGLATQVAALRLILADGSLVECSADVEPDLFAAARVGLGALGIISTVTIRCVPAFSLRAVERRRQWVEVLGELDELIDGNEHFELFWFPHTEACLTKENNRTDAIRPLGRVRSFVEDDLLANAAFGAVCRLGRRVPSAIPVLSRLSTRAIGVRTYADRSDKVFTSARRVRFVEMEYAFDRALLPRVVAELRAHIERSGLRISFPVEVRVSAADEVWLSPASGRETAYVAVHVFRGTPHDQYFQGVEAIMNRVGGRPHWGKMHDQTAATLRPRYPRFDDFVALRHRLDPDRRFANPYLDRVLGP